MGIRLVLLLSLLGVLGGIGGYIYLVKDLPDHRNYQFTQSSKVYAADGTEIGELFQTDPTIRRTVVPIGELPLHLIDAVLAAEDADFYSHQGLDYLGLLRAAYKMVTRGKISGGGSTITQQTVKNMLLTPEKKFKRKFKELILARRLESSLTKDEILHIYLNLIYLGHGRNGIEQAARYYYGIPASKLSLAQSATIAGLIQSPENLSPKKNPDGAKRRQTYVLDQMVDKGFLGKSDAEKIKAAPLPKLAQNQQKPAAFRWFTDAVIKELAGEFSLEELQTGGYSIHTTMDSGWQKIAHDVVSKQLENATKTVVPKIEAVKNVNDWIKKRKRALGKKPVKLGNAMLGVVLKRDKQDVRISVGKGTGLLKTKSAKRLENALGRPLKKGDVINIIIEKPPTETVLGTFRLESPVEAGFIVLNPETGDIRAMIGGYDWKTSQFNRALQIKRQIGSTFKPFVYGAAFASRRYTLSTFLDDSPETIKLSKNEYYRPKNYSGRFSGKVTLRDALAKSINTTAIRTTIDIGNNTVIDFAKSCGLEGPFPEGPSLALGTVEASPLNLAMSYLPFATNGRRARPRLITRIERGGDTLRRYEPEVEPGIPSGVAYLVRQGLIGVVQNGTAKQLQNLPETIGGKTGTTNQNRDAWFVGITPRLVGSVWIGRDDNKSLWKKATGGSVAAPIFKMFLDKIPPGKLEFPPAPESVTTIEIDEAGFRVENEDVNQIEKVRKQREYYLVGTEPDYAPVKMQNLDELFGSAVEPDFDGSGPLPMDQGTDKEQVKQMNPPTALPLFNSTPTEKTALPLFNASPNSPTGSTVPVDSSDQTEKRTTPPSPNKGRKMQAEDAFE